MKKTWVLAVAMTLLAWAAEAQTSANTQTSASASTRTTASAGQAGVQAQSSSSASASQQAQASHAQSNKKGNKGSAAASGSALNSTGASATAGSASVNLASGTTVAAVLSTTVDAKHNKPGDRVEAKTTQAVKQDGRVVLRKGTRLVGHVTEAQAKGKGSSESSLGIAFDHALLKNGQEVPLQFAIQAIAVAQSTAAAQADNDGLIGSGDGMASGATSGAGSSRGGLVGGAGSALNSTVGTVGGVSSGLGQTANAAVGATSHAAGSVTGKAGGMNALGQLTSSSSGVFGLEGLNLSSALSNETQGSVVASTSRNVHLASGTQMVLRAVGHEQTTKQ